MKFSQRIAVVLTLLAVLWVSLAGASGVVEAGGGAGASGLVSAAGARVVAGDETAGRAKVLIIGDSVFDAFDHVESARELLDSQQKTIFAVQGCQKLVEPGCFAWVKLSALDQLKKNAGRFSDVVVIGTGYNDRIGNL